MIKDIKELNFPSYATLSQATCTLQDMAEKFITTQVKIDGAITPDFSYDWEIEFKGEKYIMPLRQPQASKENTSLNSTIDLTFQHWAQYQLKRWYFFTTQPLETGAAVADKYIASVSLNLNDFCVLFNQVLNHYFKGAIIIDLNPDWEFAEEPTTIEISYSYLWDVLIQFYDLWAVRWQIEPNGSTDKYVIKVGYPVSEVGHIFEYGFKGGLLKVERQVQDDNIRNMLLGRGGEKNLPYRYFKDIDPDNPSFPADPDWIPELRSIYFSELRGKTFRDYVKGWKTNPHRQLTEADGGRIYPNIVTGNVGIGSQITVLPSISGAADMMPGERISINLDSDKNKPLEIPEGCKGNLREGSMTINVYSETKTLLFHFILGSKTEEELSSTVEISIANIILTNRKTGETRSSVGIPEGTYDYQITFNLYNKSDKKVSIDWTLSNPTLMYSGIQEVKPNLGNPLEVEPYNESYAKNSWAYKRGHEDEKFDPVEYVKDDTSIAKYGELMGGLENNEEIYPSIQGVTVDPYGRVDEVVDVEQIEDNDIEDAEVDTKTSKLPTLSVSATIDASAKTTIKAYDQPFLSSFEVPEGYHGNIVLGQIFTVVRDSLSKENVSKDVIISQIANVYDYNTSKKLTSVGIPAGKYYYNIEYEIDNTRDRKCNVKLQNHNSYVQLSRVSDYQHDTWDIWVKNIWGTEKNPSETDAQYAERVWRPILGDRTGEEAKIVFSTGMLSTSEDYEFVIAKTPVYDTSKTLNGVPSHWRLTLGKSDADLESTGLYLPSTMRQGKPGDHFFFVGIDMPPQYVLWAEERLDNYKIDNLDEVKDIKPTWVVSLDKVRIGNQQEGELQPLISQLQVGDSIRLADKRFIINDEGNAAAYEILYLQSITYNYREPSSSSPALIPDVEVVLSDKYETIANPIATLSGEVSTLTKQIGAMSNVEQVVRAVGDKLYLRKDGIADRSMSPTEFASLVNGRNFRSGIVGGTSWGIYQDANGNWVVEADKFKARQDLEVNNLVINQIIARGGMIIESAAQMEVTQVLETEDGYVCYFDQHNGTVANLFHVDDVAYCNRFTPENSEFKFYKRRVIAVSVDNITLTKDTDFNGEGIPDKGDIIVQYGNYTDTSRQYAKVHDVIGGGYERYLEGLDSVNADGKEYYFTGKQDGQNPRWFIGYKDRNYAEWRDGNLYIKGNIDMTAGSSLQNVDEFKNLEEKVDNLQIGNLNLLKNTRGFSEGWAGDGLLQQDKYLGLSVYYQTGVDITDSYQNIRYQNTLLLPDTEYTLSFYAKGSGSLTTYVFPDTLGQIIMTNGYPEWIGTKPTDGHCEYPLSSEWKRYFVTFRTTGDTTLLSPNGTIKDVLFRVLKGPNAAYICGAKLEKGNVPSDWSPAPEDADNSGLQFIKQIFPDGLINNTATVSQLLAVRDSTAANANVVAGIYGGGVEELEEKYGFKHNVYRKLMIFAGAENLSKVSQAKTRIYEDGTTYTLRLIAEGGRIGGFYINSNYLEGDVPGGTIKISSSHQDGIFINDSTWGHQVRIGLPYVTGKYMASLFVAQASNDTSQFVHCAAVVQAKKETALLLNQGEKATSEYQIFSNNHALYILHGNVAGFRPFTRRLNTNTTLTPHDSVLLITVKITLTLPADPEDGQLYIIKNITSAANTTLKVGATGHYINDGKYSKKTSWNWNSGEFVMLIWDATNKIWQAGYSRIN